MWLISDYAAPLNRSINNRNFKRKYGLHDERSIVTTDRSSAVHVNIAAKPRAKKCYCLTVSESALKIGAFPINSAPTCVFMFYF